MAPRIQDITEQRFGRLKVISYAGKLNNKPHWNCLCECGAMCIVMGQSLRQEKTQSCGCLQKEWANKPKRMRKGQTFGRLMTVSQSDRKEHWICRCSCGELTEVRTNQLFNGHTQSCGCYSREQAASRATKHGQSRTPAYIAMKARERNERKRQLDVLWTLEMDNALRDLQPQCVNCGRNDTLSIDHVNPLSQGHGLAPGNAVILCGSCNSTKHAKPLHKLPRKMAVKIAAAAADFLHYWNQLQE